jgi:hypothetical protein
MKFLLGMLRTVLAGGLAYGSFYLVSMFPVWCWGWLADPIDLSNISILQIILILFIAGVILSGLWYWVMALVMLPGGLVRLIAPPRKWIKITITSLVSLHIITELAFFIIVYKTGCVRIGDGTTSVAAELPIGLTIYSSICAALAIGGLLFQALISDDSTT